MMEIDSRYHHNQWSKGFGSNLRDDEILTNHGRWQRRFDSSFTVWYKEDMEVFGWVKHVLGVKVDNYKVFEDGVLMCAIANNLCEGCITREEVIYGDPSQRLQLSVKAMHSHLGVDPMLDVIAVVEGHGQEELLIYLLKLKERSDEIELQREEIKREEMWKNLMGNDWKPRHDVNLGPPRNTQEYQLSDYPNSSGYFSNLSSLHVEQSQKPTNIEIDKDSLTGSIIIKNDNSGIDDVLGGGESVTNSHFDKDDDGTFLKNGRNLLTSSEKEQHQECLMDKLSNNITIDSKSAPHDVEGLVSAHVASTDYSALYTFNEPSSEDPLKRQETYVVDQSSGSKSAQNSQSSLKRTSLKVTLFTPPQSPLEKNTPKFSTENRPADDNQDDSVKRDENDVVEFIKKDEKPQTFTTENIPTGTNLNDSHSVKRDENNGVEFIKKEKDVVTNLNDLLEDTPNVRKFPRSGFDRSVMYSPFSMPFISVREKQKSSSDLSASDQVDLQNAEDANRPKRPGKSNDLKKLGKRTGDESRPPTMTLTMLARFASRAPNAEELASSESESDEDGSWC